eukprot:789738-Pleurochrysis_carterae.AAC.1
MQLIRGGRVRVEHQSHRGIHVRSCCGRTVAAAAAHAGADAARTLHRRRLRNESRSSRQKARETARFPRPAPRVPRDIARPSPPPPPRSAARRAPPPRPHGRPRTRRPPRRRRTIDARAAAAAACDDAHPRPDAPAATQTEPPLPPNRGGRCSSCPPSPQRLQSPRARLPCSVHPGSRGKGRTPESKSLPEKQTNGFSPNGAACCSSTPF